MERPEGVQKGTVNAKVFQRLETCQNCKRLFSNLELKYILVGRIQKRICPQCHKRIRWNLPDWRHFLECSG